MSYLRLNSVLEHMDHENIDIDLDPKEIESLRPYLPIIATVQERGIKIRK